MSKLKNFIRKDDELGKYSASFTAAALLFTEFQNIKQILLADDFAGLIEEEVRSNDFLGIKTEAARKRVTQEVRRRFENAPKDFWSIFFEQKEDEQKLSLFYLCLKSYPLVMDFQVEVALKKWKSRSTTLDNFDLQMRLDEIASESDDVFSWSEKTQKKVVTAYKRMLTEAGLLVKNELTKPSNIQTDFWNYFIQVGDAWFIDACFYNKSKVLKLNK